MQRIVCRYRREAAFESQGQQELRRCFADALAAAGAAVSESRRGLLFSAPLPSGASSEAERVAVELTAPRDPHELRVQANLHLPPGLHIDSAWVPASGSLDETPSELDESVYDVEWHGAPPPETLLMRMRAFLLASDVRLTRVREKKTQHLNARALVQTIQFLAGRDGLARLVITVSVGPQGTLRPEEVLTVLGEAPAPGAVHVHRAALQSSRWRHPAVDSAARWRRR
jgi:radical SAM-linked protein